MKLFFLFSLTTILSAGFADHPKENEAALSTPAVVKESADLSEPSFDIGKISEAFGHLIGKSIKAEEGAKLDVALIIKGLQDSIAGKASPMTEEEYTQAISAMQEKFFHAQCKQNLAAADQFLTQNALEPKVIPLESGKVQYVIEKEGEGSLVEAHSSPLIRYKGKYLDGTVFGASKEGEKICLDEIIPGLQAGLVGMKEGEKRTIYIHPDLAYGINGALRPNSLLTFEIEMVQVHAPQAPEQTSVPTTQQNLEEMKEVAGGETHIR